MDNKKFKLNYDGTGNVRTFLTKVELEAALKGHVDEKKAQFAASKLNGPAFDVYTRLTDDDKKDYTKLKEELLKEFEKGQLNREEAIQELDKRRRLPDESPQTYAHKVKELVKLAYPSFADEIRKSIAKDYFVRGLYHDMQLAIKSTESFATKTVDQISDGVSRLELAGVKSSKTVKVSVNSCHDVDNDDSINNIAEKVFKKFKDINVMEPQCSDQGESKINFVNTRPQNRYRGNNYSMNLNRGNYRGHRGNTNNYNSSQIRSTADNYRSKQIRKCRSCFSTEHLVRNCPTRFCQECGQRGHDQNDSTCLNFRP